MYFKYSKVPKIRDSEIKEPKVFKEKRSIRERVVISFMTVFCLGIGCFLYGFWDFYSDYLFLKFIMVSKLVDSLVARNKLEFITVLRKIKIGSFEKLKSNF